ncbi:hypothetical protein GCM10025859_17410 [Alicyclobacillus fastidiosus]|nr:hypothetical protein GCM10025859_17410 [Alicyclobacillus fastidiosus]
MDTTSFLNTRVEDMPQKWRKHLFVGRLKKHLFYGVTAVCRSSNIGSIRVLEKTGMSQLEPNDNMLNWELKK